MAVEVKDLDGDRLRKYALKIMAAKDIPWSMRDEYAQEAILHICMKLPKFDPEKGASIYTWAYRVIQRFVGGAKASWYKHQDSERQIEETSKLVTSVYRHRKQLRLLLKPATLRVMETLLECGRIQSSEIAELANVQSAGSVRVHVCKIRKTIEGIENQED